jgi:hypothetical protein
MVFVQLRRRAPEVQGITRCSICGVNHPHLLPDHLLIGSPGIPREQGAVCETCGRVLEQIAAKLGPTLTVQVEHAQREAGAREHAHRVPPPRVAAGI